MQQQALAAALHKKVCGQDFLSVVHVPRQKSRTLGYGSTIKD